jgi:transcriptional regulator with XRE-family HTH domain
MGTGRGSTTETPQTRVETPETASDVSGKWSFNAKSRHLSPSEIALEQGEEAESKESWRDRVAVSTQRVGDRLRSIRRQKGLSLHEVEAMSNEEFKASVLGAYERGERVISVPRLMRLANIYGVPTEQLLPKEVEVDLTEPGTMDLSEGFAVDLNRLQECREPEALALARLVAMIQAERQDFNGRVLTVRGDDLRALAYFLLTTPEELCGRLMGMGLQALPA